MLKTFTFQVYQVLQKKTTVNKKHLPTSRSCRSSAQRKRQRKEEQNFNDEDQNH